ncbi:hypothetical protein PEPS_17150 [Persicobacter psychrovividus]|uniref:Uncharacterized protein n=1 Tax=Persicobacter psychrovividus TaxID=387638 RepID=A0ABN6L8C5_9BACT|nr:hypothetical protein PEPS_17150 [Persicobacter psychrovividus]
MNTHLMIQVGVFLYLHFTFGVDIAPDKVKRINLFR